MPLTSAFTAGIMRNTPQFMQCHKNSGLGAHTCKMAVGATPLKPDIARAPATQPADLSLFFRLQHAHGWHYIDFV